MYSPYFFISTIIIIPAITIAAMTINTKTIEILGRGAGVGVGIGVAGGVTVGVGVGVSVGVGVGVSVGVGVGVSVGVGVGVGVSMGSALSPPDGTSVVNDQLHSLAKLFPVRSFAVVVIVTVYFVLYERVALRVNDVLSPVHTNGPKIPLHENAFSTDILSIGSLNVTLIVVVLSMPVPSGE